VRRSSPFRRVGESIGSSPVRVINANVVANVVSVVVQLVVVVVVVIVVVGIVPPSLVVLLMVVFPGSGATATATAAPLVDQAGPHPCAFLAAAAVVAVGVVYATIISVPRGWGGPESEMCGRQAG
jgi:hypothetical protein